MKSFTTLLLSIVAVFTPIHQVLGTVLSMIVIDLVTGILAAKKRGEKINSRSLRQSVSKFFVYEIAIMSAFLCEQYLTSNSIPVMKMISTLIGIVELKSVLENLDGISGESFFRSIVSKLNPDQPKSNNDDKPKTDN